jgi:hypothetical protein
VPVCYEADVFHMDWQAEQPGKKQHRSRHGNEKYAPRSPRLVGNALASAIGIRDAQRQRELGSEEKDQVAAVVHRRLLLLSPSTVLHLPDMPGDLARKTVERVGTGVSDAKKIITGSAWNAAASTLLTYLHNDFALSPEGAITVV